MFRPRRPQKTYTHYKINCSCRVRHKWGSSNTLGVDSTFGGIRPTSDGNTVGGSPPRRNLLAPRLGHRRRGLPREPGPSRRLSRPLRSLRQLSPEDVSPAHGLGNPTPASVPPVDGPARLRPTKLLFEPTLPLSVLAPLPPAPAHRRAAEGLFN
jgi:hypothetical protein